MDVPEAVTVAVALVSVFGLGMWYGFARGLRFAMSITEPLLNIAKQAKSLMTSGSKPGMWDILGMLIQSGGLGKMLGGGKP